MNRSELITPTHLALKAIIYIRQSTINQTLTNQESLKLQYALKTRALELGWGKDSIETIDSDLGLTGAAAAHRDGFKSLIAQVTMGEVGIILSFDVTRLSRNCSDWYPLLDVCGYRHCLIADRDGVYDPGTSNGRLLLGLKGQLAEVELNTIRARLTAGILNKAQRGELALRLPVGLTRNTCNEVTKDPNQEVQASIARVFDIFLSIKTLAKTLSYFNQHGLMLPSYDKFQQLTWRKPTLAALSNILKNPAYAGLFVYGKTRTSKTGPLATDKSTRKLPRDQWKIVIPNKYPAYITVNVFDKIENILKENYAEYQRNKTRGVPRNGAALLQGIIFCGKCGHKMTTQYKNGNHYLCNHLRNQYRLPVCQHIPADPLDQYVIIKFFEAISPVELNAYDAVLANEVSEKNLLMQAKKQEVERTRYQAQLAQAQFNQVDPHNRLVAVELEKRWEEALQSLQRAERELNKISHTQSKTKISQDMVDAFSNIGKQLPYLWKTENLSRKQRKAFLRCLIDKVVVHREKRDVLVTRIVWKGGEVTTVSIPIHVGSFNELSFAKEMRNEIIAMAKLGKNDKFIANYLTQKGYRSPMKSFVLPSTVQTIRLKQNILKKESQAHPLKKIGYLSISEIANAIEVDRHWIYDRIHNGRILIEKHAQHKAYLFPDEHHTIKNFKRLKNGLLYSLDFRKEYQDA